MKDSRALSSVQALDDYFDALLEEDVFPQHDTDVATQAGSETVALKPQPLVVEPIEKFAGATLTKDKRDLSSVEKLLSQLKLDEDMEVEVEVTAETDVALETDIETETQVEVELAENTVTETVVETDVEAAVEVSVEAAVETFVDTEIETEVDTAVEADIETVEEAVVETATVEPEVEIALETAAIQDVAEDVETTTETECEPETHAEGATAPPWQNIASEYAFQVLFFESVGVTYAVPLAELGGIHRLEDCNHLIGRPDWYLGLQTERDQQLDVVDTAKWVMPEKIADNSHRDDYSYIVILGDSKWGLACNALLGTESLSGEQVRWREQAGKRPWLAGLVKEKMCALIHVEALIAMLNQGIDANALA